MAIRKISLIVTSVRDDIPVILLGTSCGTDISPICSWSIRCIQLHNGSEEERGKQLQIH